LAKDVLTNRQQSSLITSKSGVSYNLEVTDKKGVRMRREAQDCLRQAEEDLITAEVNIKVERFYASVFFSQQCAEKALKAGCIEKMKVFPQEHNLIELAKMLNAPENVMKAARELNPEYLITRYIDAANGVPADMYDRDSAQLHLNCAKEVLSWIKRLLNI